MFGFVLAIGIIISGGDPVEVAKKATLNGDYERSAILLESVKPTGLNWNDYYYYSLINHFKLNQKEKALQDIKMAEMTFIKYTRRQDCLIYMMTEDLKHWKEGDLGDIGRDMGMSSDRLRIAKGGKDTQKVQKDIVDKLDKLIKQQEDKANGGGDGQTNKGEDKDGGMNKSSSKIPTGQPASDSIVMGGKGDGKVDELKLRKIAEAWGTLPPAGRAKVIQDLTHNLPPKFEPMIKNYFEALNRMHNIKP